MGAREETLAELERNNVLFLHELRDLSDEKLKAPIAGDWSAREILVHMAGWYDTIGLALERMGRGERPAPEGVNLSETDAVNAGFVEAARGQEIPQIRKDLERGLARLEAAARSLPEDRFEEGKTALRLLRSMAGHPLEHLEDARKLSPTH